MREVSAVWVMGLMASLMNRSDMVGILQDNLCSGKVEIESECHIIPTPCNLTSISFLSLDFGSRGLTAMRPLRFFVTYPASSNQPLEWI
jgi:hypothetical protein